MIHIDNKCLSLFRMGFQHQRWKKPIRIHWKFNRARTKKNELSWKLQHPHSLRVLQLVSQKQIKCFFPNERNSDDRVLNTLVAEITENQSMNFLDQNYRKRWQNTGLTLILFDSIFMMKCSERFFDFWRNLIALRSC